MDRALKLAKTSFIQALVSGESPGEPDVAYDLKLFEIPWNSFFTPAVRVNLEPIIQRLKGMILLQRENKHSKNYNKKLKEKVKETLQE